MLSLQATKRVLLLTARKQKCLAGRVCRELSFPLRLQPQLYKPADSFGTDGQVGLIGSPGINPRDKLIGQADSASRIGAGRGTA
jgi:hypothetical protein